MGLIRSLFSGKPDPLLAAAAAPEQTFAVDAEAVPPGFFGLPSYSSPVAPAGRMDRRSAMQVPAVKRSRDLIAGTLGSLPVDLIGPDKQASNSELLRQPERDVPRSVTLTRTFEDLLFEGVAWWQIVDYGWHGYPVKIRRLDPRSVSVTQEGRVYVTRSGNYGSATEWVSDSDLIRFDSPNDALLVAGARAIRTALVLDAAAARYADGAPPTDYFSPADGMGPLADDVVVEFLNAWQTARQTRSTGYIPPELKYNVAGWSPEQLQLADARQHAVLEIARVAGIEPEELGVSTTSRTYFNAFDRKQNFIQLTLGGYRQAFEDRLSMGDVTPRGYYVKQNFDSFLRTDTLTRYQTYAAGLQVGAIDKSEIRALEDKPPLSGDPQSDTSGVDTVTNAQGLGESFDAAPEIRLDAPSAQAFEVDAEKRTVKGLLVPYGKEAFSNGQRWSFSQGTLKFADVSRVKLWVQHDPTKAIGVATELDDRPDGLYGSFRVARGAEGDHALALAEDGVLDGFSVGLGRGGKFRTKDGVNHAIEAPLMETSLTPAPSFDDARVHSVAASAATQERSPEVGDENTTETPEAPEAPDFSAITEAISQGFQSINVPARETVSASGVQVTKDELPYRFDGHPGQHSFSQDLRAAHFSGDAEARQRLDSFLEEVQASFDVTTSNTATLAPNQNRPELYVPNLTYTRPLWGLVTTGAVTDRTPFTIPKFNSAADLVGPHTEGVEPTEGSFTATSQTITPSAVSGKVQITREVWDQGGSPQADQIIWGEMLNAYYEALEAKVATVLAAVATPEINLAGATDEALVDAVQNVLVGLQYTRGGNRYTALALDGTLFGNLVNASDTSGRKLLPVMGPSNAQGQVTGAFDSVSIGGLTGRAAWALGSGNAAKSYLFVPSSVFAWASAPKKFTFEYQVATIDMAIWGYTAAAVTRDSDVKPIDATTADV